MLKSKIDKALREENKTASDLIKFIGMKDAGYYTMLKRGDLKLSTLKNIAIFLKKPIIYFIETEEKIHSPGKVEDNAVTYKTSSIEITLLNQRIHDLERIISLQDEEILHLKNTKQKQK